jgi:hypothetical protein
MDASSRRREIVFSTSAADVRTVECDSTDALLTGQQFKKLMLMRKTNKLAAAVAGR